MRRSLRLSTAALAGVAMFSALPDRAAIAGSSSRTARDHIPGNIESSNAPVMASLLPVLWVGPQDLPAFGRGYFAPTLGTESRNGHAVLPLLLGADPTWSPLRSLARGEPAEPGFVVLNLDGARAGATTPQASPGPDSQKPPKKGRGVGGDQGSDPSNPEQPILPQPVWVGYERQGSSSSSEAPEPSALLLITAGLASAAVVGRAGRNR